MHVETGLGLQPEIGWRINNEIQLLKFNQANLQQGLKNLLPPLSYFLSLRFFSRHLQIPQEPTQKLNWKEIIIIFPPLSDICVHKILQEKLREKPQQWAENKL